MAINFNEIKRSPFGNTYGSLLLVQGDDGNKYLAMQDCFGPDFFGPLTDEQLAAFETLSSVGQYTGQYGDLTIADLSEA